MVMRPTQFLDAVEHLDVAAGNEEVYERRGDDNRMSSTCLFICSGCFFF